MLRGWVGGQKTADVERRNSLLSQDCWCFLRSGLTAVLSNFADGESDVENGLKDLFQLKFLFLGV